MSIYYGSISVPRFVVEHLDECIETIGSTRPQVIDPIKLVLTSQHLLTDDIIDVSKVTGLGAITIQKRWII